MASTFPEAEIQNSNSLEVDSVSSDIATAQEIKEENVAERKRRAKENCEAMQTVKKIIVVSAIIVAVAGAAFAITKKLREK